MLSEIDSQYISQISRLHKNGAGRRNQKSSDMGFLSLTHLSELYDSAKLRKQLMCCKYSRQLTALLIFFPLSNPTETERKKKMRTLLNGILNLWYFYLSLIFSEFCQHLLQQLIINKCSISFKVQLHYSVSWLFPFISIKCILYKEAYSSLVIAVPHGL